MQYAIFLLFFYPLYTHYLETYTSGSSLKSQQSDSTSPKSKIKIRAILKSCRNLEEYLQEKEDQTNAEAKDVKCLKRMTSLIDLSDLEKDNFEHQTIVINQVFDPETGERQVLLNPYVILIKQSPILQRYTLNYENEVNAKAREQVINKRTIGYKGCNYNPKHSTCGAVVEGGKVVPYSHGFCCSCDEKVNSKRELKDSQIDNRTKETTTGKDELESMLFYYLKAC